MALISTGSHKMECDSVFEEFLSQSSFKTHRLPYPELLLRQVEKLEAEVANLRQALSDKQEQEAAMVQVRLWF